MTDEEVLEDMKQACEDVIAQAEATAKKLGVDPETITTSAIVFARALLKRMNTPE